MRIQVLTLLLCLGAAGCNTVEGFGRDVGATGKTITRAANDVKTGKTHPKAPDRCGGPPNRSDAARCGSSN